MPEPTDALSMQTGVVEKDISCVRCGYNLRTLSKAGVCPECAAPVAESLKGGPFNNAPAWWMKRVASGLGLLGVSFLAPVLGLVVWWRQDYEVLFIEIGLAGPKVWIALRMLQIGHPLSVTLSTFVGLLLQVL